MVISKILGWINIRKCNKNIYSKHILKGKGENKVLVEKVLGKIQHPNVHTHTHK